MDENSDKSTKPGAEIAVMEDIFHEALKVPSDNLDAFLIARCGANFSMLEMLRGLLGARANLGNFMELPVTERLNMEELRALACDEDQKGDNIGGYTLLEKIGEGGHGTVWRAAQEDPARVVALKVLKRGLESAEIMARFDQERQLLAMMEHPNIAKVFDAGVGEEKRAYIAMELIDGVPITKYCDRHKLTTVERIRLFIQVCLSVQHAHQKGIIHRDIKPSNILVTVVDGVAVPRLIDFGVAKALYRSLTAAVDITHHYEMVGTPIYMSPEQVEGRNRDIDTRSDIYSLGVVLYELLTGSTPVDKEQLWNRDPDEIRRVIIETETKNPSTVIATLPPDKQTTLAQQRSTQPPRLAALIRGDLDWIVLRALKKESAARYGTAVAFAEDLQRHLSMGVVLARPPSFGYRLHRWALRNKAAVAAAVAVMVSLLSCLTASLILLNESKLESARRQQVIDFFNDMLRGAVPAVAGGRDPKSMHDLLAETVKLLDRGSFKYAPETEQHLRTSLGTVCFDLGLYAAAEEQHGAALRLAVSRFGTGHLAVAECLQNLGNAQRQQPGRLAAAEATLKHALVIRRQHLGPLHASVAVSLNDLGLVLQRQRGRLAEAAQIHGEALAVREALGGAAEASVAVSLGNLAEVYHQMQRLPEAEALHRRALEILVKQLGGDHPAVAKCLDNLANVLHAQRRLELAEKVRRKALALFRQHLDGAHPLLARAVENLALVLEENNQMDEAEKLHREALVVFEKKPSLEHATVLQHLALVLRVKGRLPEAEALLRRELRVLEQTPDASAREFLEAQRVLAEVLAARGGLAPAEALLSQCFAVTEFRDGALHEERLVGTARQLARLYERHRQDETAASWRLKAKHLGDAREQKLAAELQRLRVAVMAVHGAGDEKEAVALEALSRAMMEHSLLEAAEAAARQALKVREAILPDALETQCSASDLGACLLQQGRLAEAEPLLLQSCRRLLALRPALNGPDLERGHKGIETALRRMADFYEQSGRGQEALKARHDLGRFYEAQMAEAD